MFTLCKNVNKHHKLHHNVPLLMAKRGAWWECFANDARISIKWKSALNDLIEKTDKTVVT